MSKKRSSGFAKKKSGMTPQNWRLKKVAKFLRKKIEGWHPQLPPRVSPTLVTPLLLRLLNQLVSIHFSSGSIIPSSRLFAVIRISQYFSDWLPYCQVRPDRCTSDSNSSINQSIHRSIIDWLIDWLVTFSGGWCLHGALGCNSSRCPSIKTITGASKQDISLLNCSVYVWNYFKLFYFFVNNFRIPEYWGPGDSPISPVP